MLHRSAWFRPTMAVSCLLVALTTGIHYYKHENSSSNATSTGGSTATLSEVGGDSIQHEQSKGGGAMDAILNALKIFDPVWFDRHIDASSVPDDSSETSKNVWPRFSMLHVQYLCG
jgi:hypothetical protein